MIPNRLSILVVLIPLLLASPLGLTATATTDNNSAAGLYPLKAIGMRFDGPATIASGWTTFRFQNLSPMIHFAMVDEPPAEISLQAFYDQLMYPFQTLMDAMNDGDQAAVESTLASFPPWLANLGRAGGPGLLSPGLSADTTVFLRPGRYVLECYVKNNGVFHTTGPAPGEMGMVLELTVTEQKNGAPEPASNVDITLFNDRIELSRGNFQRGSNTIKVSFAEQQAFPSFAGNDVHLFRVDNASTIAATSEWMDWRTPDGMQEPGPATFLGGIQDMPAGAHGYLTVELQAGDYALMAEAPDPMALGLVMAFSVR